MGPVSTEPQVRTSHVVAEALDHHGAPATQAGAEDLLDAHQLDDQNMIHLTDWATSHEVRRSYFGIMQKDASWVSEISGGWENP